VILYHRTSKLAARGIRRHGFRDSYGYYGLRRLTSGVWLSYVPLSWEEGAEGDTLLRITLPNRVRRKFERYEWIERGKSYREFQVPAAWLNRHLITVTRALPSEDPAGAAWFLSIAEWNRHPRERLIVPPFDATNVGCPKVTLLPQSRREPGA
jgi:hypothetical protein